MLTTRAMMGLLKIKLKTFSILGQLRVHYCVQHTSFKSNFPKNTIARIKPAEINTVDLGKSNLIAHLRPLLLNWNIHNLIVLLLNMIPKWLYFKRRAVRTSGLWEWRCKWWADSWTAWSGILFVDWQRAWSLRSHCHRIYVYICWGHLGCLSSLLCSDILLL